MPERLAVTSSTFADRLVDAWYAPGLTPLSAALLPLSWLFRVLVSMRQMLYRAGLLRVERVGVPVVVVGNISVGGVGKTPLVCALALALRARGWHPGIVARGYGGSSVAPRAVHAGDDPRVVGDEPLLLAATDCPVWIGRARPAAARGLLAAHPACDVVIADDGLQHYALARDVEVAVVDAARGLGNGRMLPAGPLREPRSRLARADCLVSLVAANVARPSVADGRNTRMTLKPHGWRNLVRPDAVADPDLWRGHEVHALAGIGHPRRFFDSVQALGIDAVEHAFPDHHAFSAADLAFPHAAAIVMTEKDAVKCRSFADDRCWYLPVHAAIDPALVTRVEEKIRGSQAA
jgi:tetraacyldisaccharide 4'-kinase